MHLESNILSQSDVALKDKNVKSIQERIDEFILMNRIEEMNNLDLRERLNAQEEEYLELLQTKHRENAQKYKQNTQNLSEILKKRKNLDSLGELTKKVETLVEKKSADLEFSAEEFTKTIKKQREQIAEFEAIIIRKNQHIQLLIREIKSFSRNDKQFSNLLLKDAQLKRQAEEKLRESAVASEALAKILQAERNKQKNLLILPKVAKVAADGDDRGFWGEAEGEKNVTNVVLRKQPQKFKSISQFLHEEELWAVQQDKENHNSQIKQMEQQQQDIEQEEQKQVSKDGLNLEINNNRAKSNIGNNINNNIKKEIPQQQQMESKQTKDGGKNNEQTKDSLAIQSSQSINMPDSFWKCTEDQELEDEIKLNQAGSMPQTVKKIIEKDKQNNSTSFWYMNQV